MATSVEDVLEKKKKRKRKDIKETKRKLLVGEKVEVRSSEEGFSGSWHSATIIACRDSVRSVKYDNLLVDDGSKELTEVIKVSSMIDGVVKKGQDFINYRGLIRPFPPSIEICKFGLHYGLCVDALVNDAWWEGVIFDYEDGSMERLVFFPDLGDQQMVKIEELRITQDWDEVKESWKSRGNWVFLELIEEYEREWPVVVSVRQIWYELRAKKGFRNRIKEWTCSVKPMWADLVFKTIRHNLELTAEQVLNAILSQKVVNLADRPTKRMRSKRKNLRKSKFLAPSGSGVVSRGQEEGTQFALSFLVDPVGNLSSENEEGPSLFRRRRRKISDSLHVVLEDQVEECTNNPLDFSCDPEDINLINSDSRNLQMEVDKPPLTNTNESCDDEVVTIQIQETSALPSDLNLFANVSSNLNREKDDAQEARGIVLDYDEGHGSGNDRTFDGGDNSTFSNPNLLAHTDCTANEKREHANNTFSREDEVQGGGTVEDARNSCWSKDDLIYNKPIDKPTRSRRSDKRIWLPAGSDILPRAEFCPEALVNYLMESKKDVIFCKNNLVLQARMHLSYLGWKIERLKDSIFSRSNSKRGTMFRFRYTSPEGKTEYSLRKVCKLIQTASNVHTSCSRNGHETARVDAPVNQLNSSPQQVPFFNNIEKDQGCSPCVELLESGISKRKLPIIPISDELVGEPEYCPQALRDYYELQKGSKKGINGETATLLRQKARKHLLALGWNIFYVKKQNRRELRYASPTKKCYISLSTACEGCMEEGFSKSTGVTSSMGSSTGYKFYSAIMPTEVVQNALPIKGQFAKGYTESSGSSQSKENLEVANIKEKAPRVHLRSRKDSSFPLSQENAHLHSRQNGKATTTSYYRKLKKKKGSGFQLDSSYPTRVLRSSKRARQVVVQSPAHHTPRTVLSWLIESNVVLPRAKVRYLRRKDDHPLAEGRITRDGIKCNCCQKVFGLSGFEAHAGSKLHRPSARIFLEDGRSLLDCQQQVVQENKRSCFTIEPCERIKSNQVHKKNDYICSVCHYGGTLVLCDQCPSSFHLSCLGLEDLPDGKWFCPSCRCGICGQSEFHGDFEQCTEKTVLCCDQCNREYHEGCIRMRGSEKPERYAESNWFCSEKCRKIFEGLHKLLGKSVPLGVDNLSWTILKSTNDVYHYSGASDIEAMTEHQSKLNVALGLMHECFEPIKEPHTRRDLIKDVLFNNTSELNRLNFRGFYTLLLEREDELISVATVRVHGEKVAEVPLVGTCVQYRRQGMCRILFDALEKELRELEVERLLLPAVPQVLHTWTTSFGFSKMTNSERLEFLEYTFLDFQDTTMCQKILRTAPAVKSTKPRGNQPKLLNELSQSKENIDMNRHSIICEVIEAEQVEHSQIVEQQPVHVAVENGTDSVVTAPPLDVVTILDESEQNRQNSDITGKGSLEGSDKKQKEERGCCVKYYKRRRI
ncbi:GNAT domain [Macleaya cordata]|uniref:GNAT domain n=1 Tax=Macleaya cordata TaxID=56857 RepID=A0A200PLM1_MACCD|nr:GNAT domain [Macleaya cordata]